MTAKRQMLTAVVPI